MIIYIVNIILVKQVKLKLISIQNNKKSKYFGNNILLLVLKLQN